MNHIRLRQVTVIARDLEPAVERMKGMLRLPEPFRDDLANQFATVNAVFQLGNSFVEIASPFEDGTVRRYAEARGGDAGYMAVFQVPDNEEARARVTELGIRIIAELKLFDQGGNLLHPKDVPGAMVTFDWSRPYEAWRWGGPAWSGRVPEHPEGGIVAMEVGMVDPVDAAEKWARALGVEVSSKTSTEPRSGCRGGPGHPVHRRRGQAERGHSWGSSSCFPPISSCSRSSSWRGCASWCAPGRGDGLTGPLACGSPRGGFTRTILRL